MKNPQLNLTVHSKNCRTEWRRTYLSLGYKLIQHLHTNMIYYINKMNNTNSIITPIRLRKKSFDKIKHPFMTETLSKQKVDEMYFSTISTVLWQVHVCYTTCLHQWRLADIPRRSKARCPLALSSVNSTTRNPNQSN